jgi:cbb3-type cytochrome oxidase subunit 3
MLGGLEETAREANIDQLPASPSAVAGTVLQSVLSFVGILFLGLMLYAGFLWMTAGGNEEKVDQAKKIILAAVVGLIIISAAYAITQFVGQSITTSNTSP